MWNAWTDPGKKQWYEGVVAAYEKAHPNVKITTQYYGNKADLYTQLNAADQAGGQHSPDIHFLDVRPLGHIPQQQNGWLLNLKDYGLDASLWDPGVLGAESYDNGIWGVPVEAFGIFMWYDQNVLTQWGFTVPANGQLTLDEFNQICAKAKQESMFCVGQGVQDGAAFAAHFPISILLNEVGAQPVFDAVTGKAPLNSTSIVDGLQKAVDMVHADFNPNVATLKSTEGAALLYTHKAAFTIEGSWLPGWEQAAKAQGGEVANFKLGVMRVPTISGGQSSSVVQWGAGSGFGVSKFTKHPQEAVDFLNVMASPESCATWYVEAVVPTGMACSVPSGVSDIVTRQLQWKQQGPTISPAVYQIPAGDLNTAWQTGMGRFFADPTYTAKAFLDQVQQIQASSK